MNQLVLFFKSRVSAYIRKDGVFVNEHYRKRNAAQRAASSITKIGGKLLGSVVGGHNSRQNSVSLLGSTVHNAKELASMCQVFRNPQFETFRVFFVKDSRIIGQTGLTSRLPGTTAIPFEFVGEVAQQAKRIGADGVWALHNHPSGNPAPSPADTSLSNMMAAVVPGFLGHIIINSTKFSSWRNGQWETTELPWAKDWDEAKPEIGSLSASPSFLALHPWCASAADMAMHAKAAQNKSNTVLVSLSNGGRDVRSIAEFDPLALTDPRIRFRPGMPATIQNTVDAVSVALRRFAIQSGASDGLMLFCSPEHFDGLYWLAAHGMVRDLVCDAGDVVKRSSAMLGPELEAAMEHHKALGVLPTPSHRVNEFFSEAGK